MTELPEMISLEKFREIAHVSKRKAKWMLENSVIPCADTGKPTHRFLIKREDVLSYLENQQEIDRRIPAGIFGKDKKEKPLFVQPVDQASFSEFLLAKWRDQPDALRLDHTSALTGYDRETIRRAYENAQLEAVDYYGKLLIPKSIFIDFIITKINTEKRIPEKLSDLVGKYRQGSR